MASSIVQLCELISTSASTLVRTCADAHLPLPHLDDELSPTSGAFRQNPSAAEAANIISAAALQLVATLLPPQQSIINLMGGHLKAAALRVCLECNVTEILREAGPEGLHADKIAAKTNINSMKVARILRVLANHHVYKEITPDVFGNTLLSRALDTGKSVEDIQADPESKHDDTLGFPALVEHALVDGSKASAFLLENLRDPLTANSDDPSRAPVNRAFKIDVPLWTWYDEPEQSYRRRRFAIAMHGIGKMQPPEILLNGFNWGALPKGALVVDVGGGTGASALLVAKAHPQIDIVVQDSPEVVEVGKKLWSTEYPEALHSGRVKLQGHDFLKPQPLKGASVFLLKQILHDWSDPYVITILSELRKAALESTQLVIIDNIMSYACHDPSMDEKGGILSGTNRDAPPPLLANFGAANELGYMTDMMMMVYHNSQERTFPHLSRLLQETGWSVIKARRADPPNNFFEPIVAVPI